MRDPAWTENLLALVNPINVTMKKIFFFLLLSFPGIIKAQQIILPIDSTNHQISFSEVVRTEGVSKDELYSRGREWFARTFISAQSVIQMDDKSSGKIIGKGVAKGTKEAFLSSVRFTLFYTVILTFKDNRYRYEITDFYVQNDRKEFVPNPQKISVDIYYTEEYKTKWGEFKDSARDYLLAVLSQGSSLSKSIKNSLNIKGVKSKDDF